MNYNIFIRIKIYIINFFNLITNFIDEQSQIYNDIYRDNETYILRMFALICVGASAYFIIYDIFHPDVVSFYKSQLIHFKDELFKTEEKLNKIRNFLKNTDLKITGDVDLKNYLYSISIEIDNINEVYNFRNFSKFINLIEERQNKIDMISDWLNKEVRYVKTMKKKKVIEDLKDEFPSLNFLFNSNNFKKEANDNIINEIFIILTNIYLLFFFIIIFIIIIFFICYFFFNKWDEVWLKIIWFCIDVITFLIKKIAIIFIISIFISLFLWFFSLNLNQSVTDIVCAEQLFLDKIIFEHTPEEQEKILRETLLIEHKNFYFVSPQFIWLKSNIDIK